MIGKKQQECNGKYVADINLYKLQKQKNCKWTSEK
jgi:hypothetical protein